MKFYCIEAVSLGEWVGGRGLVVLFPIPLLVLWRKFYFQLLGFFSTLSLSLSLFLHCPHPNRKNSRVYFSALWGPLLGFSQSPKHPAAVPVRVLMCWSGNRPFPDIFPYRQVYLMQKNTSEWFQSCFQRADSLGRNYWMSEVKPDTSHQMPMEHKKTMLGRCCGLHVHTITLMIIEACPISTKRLLLS